LEKLRLSAYSPDKAEITPDAPLNISLQELNAAGYDVIIEISVGKAKQVEFTLCGIPATWDSAAQKINGQMPLPATDGKIGFRALIDRASIEIFANNGESILIVKELPQIDAPRLSITSCGGTISATKLEIHGLCGIFKID
jgi:sucrose-6-phosphate hydrolase SacC (GH32 family)